MNTKNSKTPAKKNTLVKKNVKMLITKGKTNPVLKMYGHLIIENLLRTGRTDFH